MNYRIAFDTLSMLVDKSVNYQSSEDKRCKYHIAAYWWKQCIENIGSEGLEYKYTQNCLHRFVEAVENLSREFWIEKLIQACPDAKGFV